MLIKMEKNLSAILFYYKYICLIEHVLIQY